ncbi:MAG: hypothetical protein K0S07_900 [Chlamydiales bacterium]|jgi:hypothetical protein|nr:hypothetical protein [Chlamydiales bacterium]
MPHKALPLKELLNLVSLTKLHLLRDFAPNEWVSVSHIPTAKERKKPESISQKSDLPQSASPLQNTSLSAAPKEFAKEAAEKSEPLKPQQRPEHRQAPKQEPSQIAISQKEERRHSLKLEALPIPELKLADVEMAFKILFPHVEWIAPLDDAPAKEKKNAWQKPKALEVLLLTGQEKEAGLALLQRLSLAFSKENLSAAIMQVADIERKDLWPRLLASKSLKLLLITDIRLITSSPLQAQLKPEGNRWRLETLPLYPLDIEELLAKPSQRTLIWKEILGLLGEAK